MSLFRMKAVLILRRSGAAFRGRRPVDGIVRRANLSGRLRRGALYHSAAADRITRDTNGNRLIVDGLIQNGASAYSSATGGVSSSYSGAGGAGGLNAIGGASAIGNSLNVVVQGNHNTVIVNSTQTNNGAITAGTARTAP